MSRLASLVALLLVAAVAPAKAPDPLRLIPKEAGFVLAVENPRTLVEGVARLDVYRNLRQFPQVRETLDSAQVKRFFQLVAHLEGRLGVPWPEALDKLAGGGIALGTALGQDPAPALLVIQGTDPAAVETAFDLLVGGIEEEAARDGNPNQPLRRETVNGSPVLHVGKDAHFARVGAVLLVANQEDVLAAGLKRAAAGDDLSGSVLSKPTVTAARRLAGTKPAAWGWLDLAAVKATEEAKNFFEATRKDILQTLVIGGTVDAIRRADFVSFAVEQSANGYALAVRLPAPRPERDEVLNIHLPPANEPGHLPLLLPDGVLYSQSLYLDLAHLWGRRRQIVNPENLRDIDKAAADINKVLPNTTLDKLFEQSGPYHRFVSAHTGEKLYAIEPGQPIPPAAVVVSMRDAEFGESMTGVLRAGALLAGFQTGWTMKETEHAGVPLVSYRFSEKAKPKFEDAENLRFNFAPTFAVVGKSLVVGSTPGIVQKLIPVLKAEGDAKPTGGTAVWTAVGSASGIADVLLASPDSTVTTTVLTQGVSLDEARKQVTQFADWLRTVGTVEMSLDHGDKAFEFKLAWRLGK